MTLQEALAKIKTYTEIKQERVLALLYEESIPIYIRIYKIKNDKKYKYAVDLYKCDYHIIFNKTGRAYRKIDGKYNDKDGDSVYTDKNVDRTEKRFKELPSKIIDVIYDEYFNVWSHIFDEDIVTLLDYADSPLNYKFEFDLINHEFILHYTHSKTGKDTGIKFAIDMRIASMCHGQLVYGEPAKLVIPYWGTTVQFLNDILENNYSRQFINAGVSKDILDNIRSRNISTLSYLWRK